MIELREAAAALRDRNGQVRSAALRMMAGLGAHAAVALPELSRLVRTEDEYSLRGELHKGLAALAAHAPGVVEMLREALREPDALTRRNALSALAAIGPAAAAALPDLQALLDGPTTDGARWSSTP